MPGDFWRLCGTNAGLSLNLVGKAGPLLLLGLILRWVEGALKRLTGLGFGLVFRVNWALTNRAMDLAGKAELRLRSPGARWLG